MTLLDFHEDGAKQETRTAAGSGVRSRAALDMRNIKWWWREEVSEGKEGFAENDVVFKGCLEESHGWH